MAAPSLTGPNFTRKHIDMIGNLIVAPPAQEDEFWAKSVIFIYQETATSVVGLVVNKPSDRTLSDLAEHHNISYSGNEVLYIGGPVNPSALVMLHTDDWVCSNTMQICDGYRVSSDKSMLKRVCSGDTPRKWKLFLGMSGWIPQQLAGEMMGNSPWSKKTAWLTAKSSEQVVFGKDANSTWKKGIDAAASGMVQSYFTIS